METDVLSHKVNRLPSFVQQEVLDYVEYLIHKYHINKPRTPRAGFMKGTFMWMSEDFNAPLEDFNDYQ
jgi:hypothetical protein